MEEIKNKHTILIVEDEPDIREVYSEFLVSEGYGVEEAADGKQGLEKARTCKWDLMLLDIMIPELDGISLLKLLKNEEGLKSRPVILLTNVGNENLISEAFEYGAEGYLIKAEITPDKILNEVQNFLS